MKNKTHTDSLALARRIRAAGVPIYIAEDDGEALQDPSSGLLVYQVGAVFESRAFDYYGGAGYIIHANITVNLPRFAIVEYRLELPWNSNVRWVVGSLEIDGRSTAYHFGGKQLLEFDRSEVLNHCADTRRMRSRGESLRGHLLGIGDQPIPEQFQHGAMIPAFLIIYDQFWREYRSSVSLFTDRSEKPARHARSVIEKRGRLFDHRDPVARG